MASDNQNNLAKRMAEAISRSHLTAGQPAIEGGSFFFEVKPGWETRILRDDSKVTTVLSVRHLEEVFSDPSITTVFIPADSAITRTVARRVCRRHGNGKTIFFEIANYE